ncbi:MAG TPA: glycosyltransferase family 2 protein [Candidatus Eisenbacteria bacterium]|nr:glycosyltransferase family 2 protein [Candidatus Eisenbacteria bacterium]
MLAAPVVFIIFNRPEATSQVFREIARARPKKLFIIADGPRNGDARDAALCAQTRAVVERIDWKCEVFKKYSSTNVGLTRSILAGIDWVFDQVEEAIILEDDCLPHPTFFPYCAELLEKYRADERVMMIAGRNRFRLPTPYSYCFTYNHSNWGWATWRRAWRHHDLTMESWPRLKKSRWLSSIIHRESLASDWERIFDEMHATSSNPRTWDYQWTYAVWSRNGLAVTPSVNLIKNIGFGEGATNTTSLDDTRATVPAKPISFPLIHPPAVARDALADHIVFERMAAEWGSEDTELSLRRRISRRIPERIKAPLRRIRRYSLRRYTAGAAIPEGVLPESSGFTQFVESVLHLAR